MAHANLPISFWRDALLTAVYSLNRMPSKSIPVAPYELWHSRKPSLAHLRPWGSAFIRYPEHSKGYFLCGEHPNGGMTEIDSCNDDFLKDEFPSIGEIKMDLALYESPLDDHLSLGEGENMNTHRVTEDSTPSIKRYDELLVTQENQHDVGVRSSSPNMMLNMRIEVLILHPLRILLLLEIQGEMPQ